MQSVNPAFDVFVEKVVNHNRLVSPDILEKAKAFQKTRPELSLLDILVRKGQIQQKHAEQMIKRYEVVGGEKVVLKAEKPSIDFQTPLVHQPPPEPARSPSASNITSVGIPETVLDGTEEADDNPLLSKEAYRAEKESEELFARKMALTHRASAKTEEQAEEKPKRPPSPLDAKKQQIQQPLPIIEETQDVAEEIFSPLEKSDKLDPFLGKARQSDASDLHILPFSPPLMRVYGRLKRSDEGPLNPEMTEEMLFGILDPYHQQELRKTLSIDLCLETEKYGRFRSCFVRQKDGWEGSFRLIKDEIPTIASLGLPQEVERMTEFNQGLVLITGSSGMGKTSTMAAMVNHINERRTEHIITLEDPIEYIISPIKSHISQREIGSHSKSYSTALRAALREDPDILVIGELRDQETASLAITAAETGHLVFASLHTNSASQTISRVLDFFPPDQQHQVRIMISESIRGIVCQQLIPRKDGMGRVLALEIMFSIPAIGNLIREDRIFQLANMMRINTNQGMMMMDESVKTLLQNRLITPDEAHYAVVDQMIFQGQDTQSGMHGR